MTGRMLVVVRLRVDAVELLLVGRRHQTVGILIRDDLRRFVIPEGFLRVGHETVGGVLCDVRGRNRPFKIPPPAYGRAFQAVEPSPILCLRVSDS